MRLKELWREKDFLTQIEEADKELAIKDVPIHARPFHAFNILAPDYDGPIMGRNVKPEDFPEYEGPNLLKHIDDWFEKRYGERIYVPGDIGRVPILIRRQIYMVRIPLVIGNPRVRIPEHIDGMTEDMKRSLSKKEVEIFVSAFLDGFALIYEMADLLRFVKGNGNSKFSSESKSILISAIEDRDTSIRCLTGTGRSDTNSACFHAQQHSEKMLKAFILNEHLHSLIELSRPPFGHNISRIFQCCNEHSPDFIDLNSDIALLKNIKMDIRYNGLKIIPENAVETVWSSLRVGGFIACKLSGSKRRYRNPDSQSISSGPKSNDGRKLIAKGKDFTISRTLGPGENSRIYDTVFQESKYYYIPELDFSYLCEKIDATIATLFLVESYQHGQLFQARITQHVKYSIYYLKIDDPEEIKRLKKLYENTIDKNT